MKYYNLDIEEVLKNLDTKIDGLSSKEAQKRLKKYGENKLTENKKESNITKFLKEFKNLMIIILLISSIVSFILSLLNKEPIIDSIIIIAIVLINAILGFIQELKADKSLEALNNMQVSKVKVKRDNSVLIIDSKNIVKGDIILLESGDTLSADARIISASKLKVDESSLTGESRPVSKTTNTLKENTPLIERTNMLYSGTNIVYGKCTAVVCITGMDTEFGTIAKSLNNNITQPTSLQKKINSISKFLSIIIFIIIVLMFILGLIKQMNIKEIIMLSISLSVAAIPEGLPAVITITLSLGMNNMAKKKAIVRKMSSVETLGCVEVICSDKTGTITQNKMKVIEVYFNKKICTCKELEKDNILLKSMALNNDTIYNKGNYIGEPTEIALYEACSECINVNELRNKSIRINELPFDSERKMMSTINKDEKNITLYTKGSFDSLIKCCTYIYEDNKIRKLTKKDINKLKEIETKQSNKAYRVLAYAYKIIDESNKLDNLTEKDLIFIGMTSMIDPPRENVKESINECKKADIKPVMITGDSLSTATAIAKEIGIISSLDEAITGEELDKMTKKELIKNVKKYSVYARVSPTNKLDIINAWKQNNKVTLMAGDGVNDAPALKAADIGVGMGINGTEVSKSVSDIVLADDSFETIVTAVKEGRRIYDNIRNVLVYLLTGNTAEILIVFIGMIFGIQIFLPIQLLYINLITDSIPAIALSFEKEEENIMSRKSRKSNTSFLTPFLISKILTSGILKTISVLLIYFVNLKIYNLEVATTMSFLTLILLEMIYAYSCRNLKRNILNKNIFSNNYMNKCTLLLIIIQITIFITPLKNIFKIVNLSFIQVAYCFIVVILIFIINELTKNIHSKLFRD